MADLGKTGLTEILPVNLLHLADAACFSSTAFQSLSCMLESCSGPSNTLSMLG